MESRADRRTSHALHTVTTHDHASDRPGYFIGELRLRFRGRTYRSPSFATPGSRERGRWRWSVGRDSRRGLEMLILCHQRGHVVVGTLGRRAVGPWSMIQTVPTVSMSAPGFL